MPLTISPNVPLNRPSLRILMELDLSSGTLRATTEDMYPLAALGGVLFEKRLAAEPTLTLATGSEFGGIQRVEECTCDLSNADLALDVFFSAEQRGRAARVHIYDKETAELQQNVFSGVISSFDFDLHTVAVSLVNMDFAKLGDVVPRSRVNITDFPEVGQKPAPSGGLGDIIPYGWGVGLRMPGRYCRTWNGSATMPEYYDYVFGTGNLGLDVVWRNGDVPEPDYVINDPTQYLPLYRTYTVNGRYVTAIRFFKDMTVGMPITADVQRVYPDVDASVVSEWKWKSTFRDDIGTRHATSGAGADLSTASLVAGPTGVGLGAVFLDGVNDFLDIPDPTAFQLNTFSLETWVKVMGAANIARIVLGPSSNTSGHGWDLAWNGLTPRFEFRIRIAGSPTTLQTPSVVNDRWYALAVVRDGTANTTKLYMDGVLVATSAASGAVSYTGASPNMQFGPSTPDWFPGSIGYTRFSQVARTAREIAKAYWMMRRNGIEFLRDFAEKELLETVDSANFDTAATDWDNVPNPGAGSLKCDGWVTEESTPQAIIESLVPFRDLRLARNSAGALQVFVAKAATTVAAQFGTGIGEQFGNVVSVNRRLRASLAEAIKELPIHYRVQRDPNGSFKNFQFTEMKASGLAVGRTGEPLLLPFVYDHVTGDIIRSFRGKRIVTRDELMDITLGHEARELKPGKIARLTFTPLNIVDKDYETLVASFRRPLVDVTVVPYAEADYTYVPSGTLPTDIVVTAPITSDFGTPSVALVGTSGSVATGDKNVRMDIELINTENQNPVSAGTHQQSHAIVGAATRLAAISQTDPSGSTSYVVWNNGGPTGRDTYHCATPQIVKPNRKRRVALRLLMRKVGSGLVIVLAAVRMNGITASGTTSSVAGALTNSFAYYTINVDTNPVTGLGWTANDLTNPTLELGYEAFELQDTLHIAEFSVNYVLINEQPTDFGYSSVWHSLTSTPVPPSSEPPVSGPYPYLTGHFHGEPGPTVVGTQYYFARVFDRLGRAAPGVGQLSVVVSS